MDSTIHFMRHSHFSVKGKIIHLTERTYQDLLQKQLYMAITAPGGNSRLYKALKFAVKNFFEHRTEF